MAENTAIEWADATVNFWAGCSKVSPACDHCYAERMAGRLWGVKWGAGEQRLRFEGAAETARALNRKAERTGKRLRVFCNSMSDVFDNEVDPMWRADLFESIRRCENLDFLLLTKRSGNVIRLLHEVASLLRSEHGTQAEREHRLQVGPVGRVGDRLGRADLASHEADRRQVDWQNKGHALQVGACGNRIPEPGLLSAGPGDDRREAAPRGGRAAGVAAHQWANPAGVDDQPPGWEQAKQPAAESGVGDVQRAAPACGKGAGSDPRGREGIETSESSGVGNGRGVYASTASQRLAREGHRGALRDHAEVGFAYLHRQDLAARAELLSWVERWLAGDAPANVWLGATICNQEEADRDIPKLLAVPAHKRFLSIEPMLGPVDLSMWLGGCDRGSRPGPGGVGGVTCVVCNGNGCPPLDWVIVGGESGPKARPMKLEWVENIRQQCEDQGVQFFFKQWGGWGADGKRRSKKAAGRLLDGREWSEVPA